MAAVICAVALCSVGYAAAGSLHAVVEDQHGNPVSDAVVLATPLDPKILQRGRHVQDAVDQVDKQFVPYVRVIYVGSRVAFPNRDNIRHQVYSFSPARKFELPLYAGFEAPPVLFDKPGVVVLGCNIHDWMLGYIYVADTPFFAQTGAGGNVATDLRVGLTACVSGIRACSKTRGRPCSRQASATTQRRRSSGDSI